ncbi:MAG: molybdopterin-dependent oxidoreductase [Desulfobacterales bacterium]
MQNAKRPCPTAGFERSSGPALPGRRRFLARLLALAGMTAGFRISGGASASPPTRRILPPGTRAETLLEENPAHLDIRHLEITPPGLRGVMGQRAAPVELKDFALTVEGLVERTIRLPYGELTALPSVARRALLVCPGTFSFLALWKGVRLVELLERAGRRAGARFVDIATRPDAYGGRVERFSLAEIGSDRLLLAWAVDGGPLPEPHGHPLRLVAEDRYGNLWVKYVEFVRLVG